MAKVPVIDIRPCDLATVREILRRHVPNHEVLAFGSRVKWTARQYSDLDLAIRSDEAIPTSTISAIKNELSESRLPMMVDVLDMASVSETFRGIIEEEYAVVQEKNDFGDWEETQLAEQKKIAGILGALDDKIELNRRMNKTLEAMAQAIFKSWFIDFAPVHANAGGRNPGRLPEIAALFPAQFQDSELGKIPRGWEVKPLDEITELGKKPSQYPGWFCHFWGGRHAPGFRRHRPAKAKVVVPDARLLKVADKQLAPFFAKIASVDQTARAAAALRDALIPALLFDKIAH